MTVYTYNSFLYGLMHGREEIMMNVGDWFMLCLHGNRVW